MEEQWNYEDKREEGKMNRLKPIHGILLFIVVMVSFYTVIAWAQMKWGMYGLALTELYLLALALGGAKLLKVPFKEGFPVQRPRWQKVFAVLLCWIASYSAVIPLTMIVAYFFPREIFFVSGSLNDFMATVPLALSVFISCVMPAVCEEAVHRGFILKSFQSRIKGKWTLVVLMGLLFGLFHGNLWRFLPTALLGAALTYLMVETENMIYPAIFHFINNFFPTLLSGMATAAGGGPDTQAVTQSLMENGLPLSFLGIYIGMGCVAPFCFYTAAYLLRRGVPGKEQRYFTSNKILVLLVVLTVIPIVLGGTLLFLGIFDMLMNGSGESVIYQNGYLIWQALEIFIR